ncbi:MAG: hypothetical protein ACK41E_06425 [Deinococcales bacterium]
MKETDWRNTLEVIVKGLVAVVVGLAALYLLGWVLSFFGGMLLGLAGIILALLRWLVPVALIVGIVYFAVTQLQPKSSVVKTRPQATPDTEATEEKPVDVSSSQAPITESHPSETVSTNSDQEAQKADNPSGSLEDKN